MRDGATGRPGGFADRAERNAGRHHCRRAFAQVGWVHQEIIEQGYDSFVSPVGFEPTLYGF
jgi:hypothetical protein